MGFPPRFLDELTARSDLVDIVGGYVRLTPRGGDYWGCCPFHSEKTPSFHVIPAKQMYYCFGCKKGGGVINFMMEMENLPYPDAVRFLAKRAGMQVPEDDFGDKQAARRRARLLELNREAALFYYRLLQSPEGEAVRAYLDRRRIRRDTAVKFGMGASTRVPDMLLNAMTEKGYSKKELLDAGLVIARADGRLHDKFRNRLMLPVIDVRGDVVAFGSRVLDKSDPKYMNSSDTPVYSKRRTLYGLNLARKSKRQNLILCEGNLDIVTLYQAGFDNAVASMGTALTQEQIQLISRVNKKELVLCYDNDGAGRAATDKALQLLHRSAISVRVLQLPRRLENGEYVKQDPDDFIKYQGADAFERLLSSSARGTEFQMDEIAGKYDLKSDEGRAAYGKEVSGLIAALQNPVERDVYIHRAAAASGIDAAAIALDVRRILEGGSPRRRNSRQEAPVVDGSYQELNPARQAQSRERSLRYENVRSAMAEEGVIRLLLTDDSLFSAEAPLEVEQFSSPLYGKAFSLLWTAREAGRSVSLNVLAEALTAEEISQIMTVCQKPRSQNPEKELADYIRVIREESERQTAQEDPLVSAMRRRVPGSRGKR